MKSLPTWNWAGNLHAGMSYHDKNLETGFLITGNIQKPNPKFISIPNKKIFDLISQPQYETHSENQYNQKTYLIQSFLNLEQVNIWIFFGITSSLI